MPLLVSARHFQHPDVIDRLDDVSELQYRHEGPYDAACAKRNKCSQFSPVSALCNLNAEILKVTPPYKLTTASIVIIPSTV
jgi:hypothetical protein